MRACVSTVFAACGSAQELGESEGGGGTVSTGRGLYDANRNARKNTMRRWKGASSKYCSDA